MSRSIKNKAMRNKVMDIRNRSLSKSTVRTGIRKFLDSENEGQDFFSNKSWIFFFLILLFLSSCVSKKVLVQERERIQQYEKSLRDCSDRNQSLQAANKELSNKIFLLENQVANEQSKTNMLDQQMVYYQSTNTNLLDRLTDLSVVSKTGAESIRKSLEAINDQNKYIKDLTSAMRAKDSMNLALVMKLKRSLVDLNDEDVTIEVKKGVVYISLSDKLLFKSGSYVINQEAENVLGKIARVLHDHKNLEILVEGHTDNVPVSTSVLTDNWDLSVYRATSVVRMLQTKYGITPERMTAGGRSEYVPKTTNVTVEGKAVNRRTEIIILPQLDQFFELLDPTAEN